jgi:hypothetical protein
MFFCTYWYQFWDSVGIGKECFDTYLSARGRKFLRVLILNANSDDFSNSDGNILQLGDVNAIPWTFDP